jgi:hypothetical protein
MKSKTKFSTFLLGIIFIFCGCQKDEYISSICESNEDVFTLTNEIGRIYKWPYPENSFYYVGAEDQATGGKGGYISCQGLPKELQKDGLKVTYSGIFKGYESDTSDPLFFYMLFTSVEKAE